MKLFFKNHWPVLVYPGWIVLLIVFATYSTEHTWAHIAVLVLLAPIPIAFAVMVLLSYGEWIFDQIILWRTDKKQFSNRIFIGLGKLFTGLIILAAVGGILWALENQNQWLIWEATKIIFYLIAASISSVIMYRCYERWKVRQKYRKIGKLFRDAANELKKPGSST